MAPSTRCACRRLPGYAPRGTADRAGQARLTLAELDAAIGTFIREVYNLTPHSETGMPPQQRWEAGAFIPRMPDSLEQLDLLLLTVAKPRKIHPDGIHFQGLRYLDPVLAAYVGDTVIIRYDPRDMAEIRVFTGPGSCAGRSAPSCRDHRQPEGHHRRAQRPPARPGPRPARAGQRRRPAARPPTRTRRPPGASASARTRRPHGPSSSSTGRSSP